MIRTVANSPIVRMKTKIDPMTIPGVDCGRTTSLNVLNALAPRSRAASSELLSIWASMKKMGATMKRM